jgi:sugar phosphate isomerase/epimerase
MRIEKKTSDMMDRRHFLKTTAATTLGMSLSPLAASAAKSESDSSAAYGGFKMGLQSFSLRNFDLAGCLERTRKLDLHFLEPYSGHIKVTADPARLAELKKSFASHGIKPFGYFVDEFGKSVESNRDKFEFARALDLKLLVGTPAQEHFPGLEVLVEEFRIPVAIHNHGPGSLYATIADVEKALEGRHKLIGICIDTGHFLRADQDPVKAVRTFGERTYGVHLKEVDKDKNFQVLGKGTMNTIGLLRELNNIKYQNCLVLEYEEHPEDPMAEIAECLRVLRQLAEQV